MKLFRDFCAASVTSFLMGSSLWLLNLSSDSLGLRDLSVLVAKFAGSYCCSVVVLHVLLKGRHGSIGPLPSWLFISIMGSAHYAAGITWTSMKMHLKVEPSIGWILMEDGGSFVASVGILTFLSFPLFRWLSPGCANYGQEEP
jgi:hypothetical protein